MKIASESLRERVTVPEKHMMIKPVKYVCKKP